jgi:hypothetical protein
MGRLGWLKSCKWAACDEAVVLRVLNQLRRQRDDDAANGRWFMFFRAMPQGIRTYNDAM